MPEVNQVLLEECLATVQILTPEDTAYLHKIERATFLGFSRLFDPATALPVDIASIAKGDAKRFPFSIHYSKTSPTNIALGFLYLLLGAERGHVPKSQAYEHALKMLGVLEMMETYQGFHFNWYYLPGRSGMIPKVVQNRFISSIDNGNLDISLMAVAGYFEGAELGRRIEWFLKKRDYGFFFSKNPASPESGMMSLGFDAAKGCYSDSDYSILNGECRMMILISILKGNVPESVWYKMSRFVKEYETLTGEKIPVVAPWGGSLFEGLFADEILGGNKIAPQAFHKNALHLISIHQDKGKRISESAIWGFSNGEVPDENRYEMAGVSEIAYSQFPGEFVTVYSSFLSLQYDPKRVIENLKRIEWFLPGSFSPNYGFTESVSPKTGARNRNILSLDKGMECLALGNFTNRLDGRKEIPDWFWRYLKTHGWADRARSLLKAEETHPSFQALSGFRVEETLLKESEPVKLLESKHAITAFSEKNRASCGFEVLEMDGIKTVKVSYDVRNRYAFSGITVKFEAIETSKHFRFVAEIKGVSVNMIPRSIKMELKSKGECMQFAHFEPAADWKEVSLPIISSIKTIDEIAVVFENAAVGNKTGELLIRDLTIR